MVSDMELLLDVIQVEARDDNTLIITFENKVKRRFDMTPYLEKKPFKKLKALPLFKRASVANGTVVWPGNIDIAPETLWDLSQAI